MKNLTNEFGGTTGQRCTAPPSSPELGKTSRDASKEAVIGEENLTNRPDAKPATYRAALGKFSINIHNFNARVGW
jgi:hypothetical protein|tara:strand:+ start:1781 stop:2005 length:225 start_codon:yes stop_codon:yes gene_type:complete